MSLEAILDMSPRLVSLRNQEECVYLPGGLAFKDVVIGRMAQRRSRAG